MNSQPTKPLVLHLAVDYPNVYRPENTLAVRNFVKANADLDYLVIALTRTANPFRAARADGDGLGDNRVVSMRYWGFPFGVLLALSMFIVALRIHREIKRRGIAPAVVHGHKLTFEGLASWWLARWLRIPLVLSVLLFVKAASCGTIFEKFSWSTPQSTTLRVSPFSSDCSLVWKTTR